MNIDQEQMQKRTFRLMVVMACWAVIIIGFIFLYSYFERDKYLEESRRLAWRTGIYPAARGRILDPQGIPLAWTERRYDLVMVRVVAAKKVDQLRQDLRSLGEPPSGDLLHAQLPKTIFTNLSPKQIETVAGLIKTYPELQLMTIVERRITNQPGAVEIIGKTTRTDHKENGISGLELQYNQELSGKNGIYRVMVNRRGLWVQGSWQVVEPPANGHDVKLVEWPPKPVKEQ